MIQHVRLEANELQRSIVMRLVGISEKFAQVSLVLYENFGIDNSREVKTSFNRCAKYSAATAKGCECLICKCPHLRLITYTWIVLLIDTLIVEGTLKKTGKRYIWG